MTDELITWLRAQLDEDEAWAGETAELAEVEAKRAILDLIDAARGACLQEFCEPPVDADQIFRHLAKLYADRPGYREEWRP
jgi:hypothetical protein